ncbi:MAG: sulfotransferase [Cellvibrionaceae bacterium]|nr:sulfotransferase [Cellvibrionaceae bacterium]
MAELDIKGIQQLIANGQLEPAVAQLDQALKNDSNNSDAHYMAAVCHRYSKRYERAQKHLDAIKYIAGDTGRIYQEQGHLYKAQGNVLSALGAFQAATQFNPALIASWKSQAELLQLLDKPDEFRQVLGQIQRFQALPKVLVAVTDLTAQGKLFKAEALCKSFLQKQPQHTEGLRLLADIATRLGAMQEAEFILESACEFDNSNAQVKIDYIQLLRKRQKYQASTLAAKKLLHTNPTNPQFLSLYAIANMQVGEYAAAIGYFDKVLEQLPNDAITHTSKGHALKTWGKNPEAIASYRAAINSNPHYCESYYSLSNLKTYRFAAGELQAMLDVSQSPLLTPANRVYLYFSLGKAYEDSKDWDQSFSYYKQGNQIKKQQSTYDSASMSDELLSQREFFNTQQLAQLSHNGYPDPAPIFIVGLPRAGSTLLEQILSSHSQVDGTLELPNMLSIAQKLRRQAKQSSNSYPENIAALTAEEIFALGKQYIDETRIHRQAAPYFIDKMPNNFRHIGLIKSLLPNAKIIDARRHPMACCFSGFKQLFAEGQEFSYSLDDIAQYYLDYVELMQHWQQVLPGEVLQVNYEDVTSDIETQVKRMLEFCGLAFESNCINFHKTQRAVRTASSEQVRQPLYKSGVDHWENYSEHLKNLRDKLSAVL